MIGTGYFIAWLWISHQPIFKLIPVFLLSYSASFIGASLTRSRINLVPGLRNDPSTRYISWPSPLWSDRIVSWAVANAAT